MSEAAYDMLETRYVSAQPGAGRCSSARQAIRRRLADPDCPDDYEILEEMRAEGVTDYLIQPLQFTNGEVHAISWTTPPTGRLQRR